MKTSSWSLATIERIRFASMAVIVHQIHSVMYEQLVVLADASGSRSLSRNQPRDGMALRRSAGDAGEEPPRDAGCDPAHCAGTRACDWRCGKPVVARAKEFAHAGHTLRRGDDHFWLWLLSSGSLPPSEVGRHARGLPRPDFMVVHNGFGSWRRVDAGADHTSPIRSESR